MSNRGFRWRALHSDVLDQTARRFHRRPRQSAQGVAFPPGLPGNTPARVYFGTINTPLALTMVSAEQLVPGVSDRERDSVERPDHDEQQHLAGAPLIPNHEGDREKPLISTPIPEERRRCYAFIGSSPLS